MKKFFSKENQIRSGGVSGFHKAFTLIELSVVLIIISILIGGSLSALKGAGDKYKERITKERIETIYQAMGNLLRTRRSLPCPSPITDVKSSVLYGIEANSDEHRDCFMPTDSSQYNGMYKSTTNSDLMYGMVPVISLGLDKEMAEDGFGNKFTYIVHVHYTTTSIYASEYFRKAIHTNIMTINDVSADGSKQQITADAIFVIISHGANGFGAFPANSSSQNQRSTDTDEKDNDAYNFTDHANEYVSSKAVYDNEMVVSSASSEVFDDIVFYRTRNALLRDFNAYSAVICIGGYLDVSYGATTTMEWRDGQYGEVLPSKGFCPSGYTSTVVKPTKRCGAFGVWDAGEVDPCVAN